MRKEFNPCPLCGESDRLGITPEDTYTELLHENGSAAINLYCNRCGLQLWEYSAYTSTEYKELCKALAKKWNQLRGAKHDEKVHGCP